MFHVNLLNFVHGVTCYEDIQIVDVVKYSCFRDACYAHGLLADDKEYVDAINEASQWSSRYSLRKLFVTLLLSNALSLLKNVWDAVWQHLGDNEQYNQRRILSKPGILYTLL